MILDFCIQSYSRLQNYSRILKANQHWGSTWRAIVCYWRWDQLGPCHPPKICNNGQFFDLLKETEEK